MVRDLIGHSLPRFDGLSKASGKFRYSADVLLKDALIGKVLPETLGFQGRMTSSRQNNARDPVNAALNYGYGFLEDECRHAINAVGLEPSVGFLHDFSDIPTPTWLKDMWSVLELVTLSNSKEGGGA